MRNLQAKFAVKRNTSQSTRNDYNVYYVNSHGSKQSAKIPSMRRIVAIFLLMLFSLQSIWVAAAPYCQHEETTGLSHVGHHTHDHHSHAADEPHGFDKDT